MSHQVKVQDGIVLFAAADSAEDLEFNVRGQLVVTKEITVGNDVPAAGQITTPDGSDLIVKPGIGGHIKLEPQTLGQIVLNNQVWPTNSADSGSFLGASALNVLSFYNFILGNTGSDLLTTSDLNSSYPSAVVGQMVVGPTVIYLCIANNTWRRISAVAP